MDEIDNLLDGLNNQQKEAVTTTEGYVRVIAGAGSGKTRALTSRYAYIVEALGINSSNILCVTFTNKAAGEMRKRVKRIIGEESDTSYIATYHGFCIRVIREEFNKIQYPKDFIIMDTEDQKTVLRDVFNELGLTSKVFTHKQILTHIGKQKASLDYLDYLLENKTADPSSQIDQVFYRYLDKQKRNFALDFNDLINIAVYIFSKNSDVLEKWQKRLHYILVDETQDSSEKQFMLVEMLSGYHKNLFVVGDPDQTIYEWRGAVPGILVDFDKQFPDAKTIIMNQNYRSTPNILNLGNTLIKKNKIRVDKDMITENEPGIDVVHFHAENDFEEGLWVANEIKELVEKGEFNYSDFAILYRAGHVSRSIEQTFVRENIPYSIYGGIRFFERKEIKDILSYLRLIEKGDDISFLRVISTPRRGLGKKFVENVARIALENDTSLLEALENNLSLETLNRPGSVDFVRIIQKFRGLKDSLTVSDLIQEVLDETGLMVMYRSEGDTERLDNIKELQNSIILIETEQQERVDLSEYLQDIALYTNLDIDSDTDQRVKLMTIHTSKGLEFPNVFLCGFTEGIIPSAMSLKERRAKALEEERRLAYVAITRAEKSFYMTESEGYNFSTDSNKYPSRFLFEISEDHYVRKGSLSKELIEEAKNNLGKNKKENSNNLVFSKGEIVYHRVWESGIIIEINSDKGEYEVKFDKTGKIKPINFAFTGLKKLEVENEMEPINESENERNDEVGTFLDVETTNDPDIDKKIRKFSEREHPKDLKMQEIVFKNQIKSFLYMESVEDLDIKKSARHRFRVDFELQEKCYDEILAEKNIMESAEDLEVKKYAEKKHKNNYERQRRTYDEILSAKKEIQSADDQEIKIFAEKAYKKDYEMQLHVYKKQYDAKKQMQSVINLEIKKFAQKAYKKDYEMQLHVYNKQCDAKSEMQSMTDHEVKKFAEKDYKKDYDMQLHVYNKQIVAKNKMKSIVNNQSKLEVEKDYPEDYEMQLYSYNKLPSNIVNDANILKEPISDPTQLKVENKNKFNFTKDVDLEVDASKQEDENDLEQELDKKEGFLSKWKRFWG